LLNCIAAEHIFPKRAAKGKPSSRGNCGAYEHIARPIEFNVAGQVYVGLEVVACAFCNGR